MTPDEYRRAIEILLQAIEIPGDEREAWLDAACRSDPSLRAEIEALIAAHEADSSLLDGPVLEPMKMVQAAREQRGALPTSPDYRFIQRIGRGATGDVYEAWQIRPGRRVAIKVLRDDYASESFRSRFEYEAEILASFRHRNIAMILAVGVCDDGRPLLAMEYIDGAPLMAFVQSNEINLASRLNLIVQLCEGVQHAHMRQIIHRDLKPSNVLVTEVDGESCVKVIDFGIGRCLNAEVSTTAPGQLIGTPSYMSPEQAGLSDEPLTTRSDVYSLGVIMFELLTGTLPFTVGGSDESVTALLHKKRSEDAPKPSARVQSNRHVRQIQPISAKQLRGDLDAIVGAALARASDDRYETAAELRRDIERHLDGLPVTARRPTILYELSRLRKRHKALAWSLAILSIVTLVAAGLVIAAQQRSAQAAAVALRQSNRASLAWAASAIAQGDAASASRALDEVPINARGAVAWRALDGLARGAAFSTCVHPAGVVAATPVGADALLVADRNGTVWRFADGVIGAQPLVSHTALIRDLVASPQGSWGAFVDREGTLVVFDPVTGVQKRSAELGPERQWRLVAPNEKQLCVRTELGLSMINVVDCSRSWQIDLASNEQRGVLASAGGRIWTTNSAGAMVSIGVNDGALGGGEPLVEDVVALAAADDADELLAACANGQIWRVALSSGDCVQALSLPGERISDLAIDPVHDVLVVTHTDGHVSVRRRSDGREFARLGGHTKRVWVTRFAPSGLCLFGDDGVLSTWDLGDRAVKGRSLSGFANASALLNALQGSKGVARPVGLAPDDVLLGTKLCAAATFAGEIAVARTDSWPEIWRGALHPLCAPQLSALGTVLAWCTPAQLVQAWDGDAVRDLGNVPQVTALAVSDDGRFIYAGTGTGALARYDLQTGVQTSLNAGREMIRALVPGAEHEVLVGCQSGRLIRWDTANDVLTAFGQGPEGVSAMLWNDGEVITGHEDGSLAFWSAGATSPANVSGNLPSTVRRMWMQDGRLVVAYASGTYLVLGR